MLLRIAWKDLRKKAGQQLLTVLMAGVAIALSIAVLLISSSLEQGMTDAAMPFDMIVGAKGSSTQLLFNTVFLQETPIGNISHDLWDELEADERVERVIPFAFGDNYQGYRMVGSTTDIFELRPSQMEASIFQLKEGRFFEEGQEAVVGAAVAKELGLSVGDTFSSLHGLTHNGTEESHSEEFTVVGILESMNRPYDTGIFVPIETTWESHGNSEEDVTALMVTPKDYSGLYQLYQEINNDVEAQAIFPGTVLGELFDMLGQTEDLMQLLTWIALAVGMIGMAVSLNWCTLGRIRENAILRVIGAGRREVLTVVVIEGLIISVASAALGLLIGHLTSIGAAHYMQSVAAMYSPVYAVSGEKIVLLAAIVLGVLLSLLPALKAYRTDVVKSL